MWPLPAGDGVQSPGNRIGVKRRPSVMDWRNIIGGLAILIVAACGTSPTSSSATPEAASSAPLTVFTHCGFWEITFDGRTWTPTSIDRGDMPEGSDSMATPGIANVVSTDRLVFTADSGLVVEFAPAPPELDPIPGCD